MNNIILNPQELGERIRKLRLKKNKTQSYFADMLYISSSYLALIESGKRVPNLDLLIHIAKFTDVTLDYLVFGDDPNCDPLQMTFNRLNDSYENRQLERAMKLAEFYLEMTKDDDKIKDNINKNNFPLPIPFLISIIFTYHIFKCSILRKGIFNGHFFRSF